MTTDQDKEWEKSIKILANVNRLTLSAIQSNSSSELIFKILNDTVAVVPYDRAILWKVEDKGTPTIVGVSGQASVKENTELYQKWSENVQNIIEPEKIQLIAHPEMEKATSILWVPIIANQKVALGLWLERWNNKKWEHEDIEILLFLLKGYGSAWEKFYRKYSFRFFKKKPVVFLGILALIGVMLIKVPLRVVAPCEIVPKDPVVITTPLEGLVDKITVTPGELVKQGTVLFQYDSKLPMQDLKVAQKKVEISQAEVNRANSLSYTDKNAITELGIDTLKLKKDKLDLTMAEFRVSQLSVSAPITGVVMMDNPEDWHGRAVKIGEKVMILSNPDETKVRLWIPEGDNVMIDKEKPVKILLNIHPGDTLYAKLRYIADYTVVTDKQVTSFVAEADWEDPNNPDIKLGLKGSAILYGEDVTIFYWIVRKPLAYVRRFIGY